MSENLTVLVPIHDPKVSADIGGRPLRPIVSGAASAGEIPVYTEPPLRDDEGDSISERYATYGDLTARYWAWKNPEAYGSPEFVGFVPTGLTFAKGEGNGAAASASHLRQILQRVPVIAGTMSATPESRNVHDTYSYRNGRNELDLDVCLDIIKVDYPEMFKAADAYMAGNAMFADGAFIMRRDIFDQYCSYLFDVLAKHDRLVDTSHYVTEQMAVPRFLEDYLTGMFFKYLQYKSKENKGNAAGAGSTDGNLIELLPLTHASRGLDTLKARVVRKYRAREAARHPELQPHDFEYIGLDHMAANKRNSYAVITRFSDAEHHLPDDVAFHATAVNEADRQPTPVRIVSTSAGPVLVTPLTPFAKTVTVDALHDGATIASAHFVLTPDSVAEQSRQHLEANDSIAQGIIHCDDGFTAGDIRVHLESVVEDKPNATDIVTGHVSIPLVDGHGAHDHLEVVALDGEGNRFDFGPDGNATLRDWVCMGDRVAESPVAAGLKIRTVTFSVRVAPGSAAIIWAHFPEQPANDGFEAFDEETLGKIVKAWNKRTQPAYTDDDYDTWFRLVHKVRDTELVYQRQAHFATEPTFSVIVPVYRTPIEYFRAMVDSVMAQSYAKWELLLVDASPDDERLEKVIVEYCGRDERIKRVPIEKNEGITLNTNAGIRAASGDFLCFLDHDDFIEPDTLYRYARAVNEHPDTDLIYCDEDKYVCDGEFADKPGFREPSFKTGWNPDSLLAQNYLCHFMAVRASVLATLELPGREFDGSQDWNMAWRIGEKARHVHHEPHVLYHWRSHLNSTASNRNQKNYALEAGRLAIKGHLERAGVKGEPVVSRRAGEGYFHIKYDLGSRPLVSIIIPNKDAVTVLHRCITTLLRVSSYQNYEIVIVENNSTEKETFEYYEWVQKLDPRIRVARATDVHGFNFSKIVNFGVAYARGDYLLLLNNDTQPITRDWIEEMLGPCMQRPDVGVVGARLLYPDETIQHVGVTFGIDGPMHVFQHMPRTYNGNLQSAVLDRDMAAVTGACLMTRRDVFEAVGGFDEQLPDNYNDVDFCLKVGKRGQYVLFNPEAALYHYESVSRGVTTSGEKELRFRADRGLFMQRWPETFMQSKAPWGNPNFAFTHGMYEVIDYEQPHPDMW